MLGLPSLLSEGAKQVETSRMINVVHQLLQLHRRNLKTIDELKDRYKLYFVQYHVFSLLIIIMVQQFTKGKE